MKLSVVIPAHDEEGSIEQTVRGIARVLDSEKIPHEILVVLDHCTDATAEVVAQLAHDVSGLVTVVNRDEAGFGMAVRAGLSAFTGDCVAIMMEMPRTIPWTWYCTTGSCRRGMTAHLARASSAGVRWWRTPCSN